MDSTSQDENASNDRWSLCPSRTLPGKFYYFNLASGESMWASDDANKVKDKKSISIPSKTLHNHEPHSPEHEPDSTGIQADNIIKSLNLKNQRPTSFSDLMPCHVPLTPLALPNNSMWAFQLPCSTSQPILLTPNFQNSISTPANQISVETTYIPLSQRFNKKFGIKRLINYGENKNVTRSVQTEDLEPFVKRRIVSDPFEKGMKSESVQTNIDSENFTQVKLSQDKASDKYQAKHRYSSKEIPESKEQNQVETEIIMPRKGILKLRKDDLRYKILAKKSEAPVESNGILQINKASKDRQKKRVTFNLQNTEKQLSTEAFVKDNYGDINRTQSTPEPSIQTDPYSPYNTHKLREPSMTHLKTDPWYIVVDLSVMLEEFDFINDVAKSDDQCCIMLPYCVNARLQSISKGENTMRPHTMTARHILRHSAQSVHFFVENEGNSVNDSIINCCLNIMKSGHHVILLTDDVDSKSNAEDSSIPCCSVQELKSSVTSTRPVTFEPKHIKITFDSNKENGENTANTDAHKFKPITPENKVVNALRGTQANAEKRDQCKVLDAQTSPIIFDEIIETEEKSGNRVETKAVVEKPSANRAEITRKRIKLIRNPPQAVIPVEDTTKCTENITKKPHDTPKSTEKASYIRNPLPTIAEHKITKTVEKQSKNPTENLEKPFGNSSETNAKPFGNSSETNAKPFGNSTETGITHALHTSDTSVSLDDILSVDSVINETSPSLLGNTQCSIFLKSDIDQAINSFCAKHIDLVENCVIWREEFMCIFVEITKDLLNKILQYKSNSATKEQRLKECIKQFKTCYQNKAKLRYVADKLLYLVCKHSDGKGKINPNAPKSDLIQFIGCGDLLIKFLKDEDEIKPFVSTAEESMTYLLDRTPKNLSPKSLYSRKHAFEQSNLRQSHAVTNRETQMKPFDIINQTPKAEVSVLRTFGRDLNKIKINSRNTLALAPEIRDDYRTSLANDLTDMSDTYTNCCRELLLKDLALSEVSSELTFLNTGLDEVDEMDEGGVMNDEGIYSREESTPDSEFYSTRCEQYSVVVLAFLAQLRKVFVIINKAVNKISIEMRCRDIDQEFRTKEHQKMKRADKYLTRLIGALQSILAKEKIDSDENVTAIFKNIETQDIRLSRYSNVITKCLEQANILHGGVVRSLNLTSEKPDPNLIHELILTNNFYNMFEN